MVRPPRLELGCTRRAPLKRGCLPFHHGRRACVILTWAGVFFQVEGLLGTTLRLQAPRGCATRSRKGRVACRAVARGAAPAFAQVGLRRGSLHSLRERRLEDQVGLEPTVTCVDGLRIRSLGRWGHWSLIGGSGWFRTTCARVKRPLHLQSGLTLRIHRCDGLRRQAPPVSQDVPCHRCVPSKA